MSNDYVKLQNILLSTDEEIPSPCTVSMWGPSILTSKRKPIEVTLICEDELVWPEMLSDEHFISCTVIFIVLNCRLCYLQPL
jgi:hypothetical protein